MLRAEREGPKRDNEERDTPCELVGKVYQPE